MARDIFFTAAAFVMVASTAFSAPDRVDIVAIYEQFIAAGVAAKHCNTTDDADRANWLKNYEVVAIRAAMALKEREPKVSDTDLKSKVKSAAEDIKSKVDAEADTNGCKSARIEQLLKLYQIQAGLHFN